jgi:SAM-dependent methyltransferase
VTSEASGPSAGDSSGAGQRDTSSGDGVRWGYRDLEVAHRYDRRRYGGFEGGLRAFFIARAVRRALRLGGVADGVVLDVACGTGVAARAAGSDVRWIGIDVSEGMLRVARRRVYGSRHLWVRADLEHPPFRPAADIDAIVCLRFLAHLPMVRWTPILGTLARMTAGPIIIGLPMRRSSKHWWRAFKRSVGLRAKRRPVFSGETVRAALSAAGLEQHLTLWQSPFTDTALVVTRRRRERRRNEPVPARAAALSGEPATDARRSP